MSLADVEKICVSCGANVAHQGRHKDRKGEYWCLPCHRARRKSEEPPCGAGVPPAPASGTVTLQRSGADHGQTLRRCSCCGAEVARSECHKNRHKEYICLKCVESGNTLSRRRWLQQLYDQSRRAALYLVIAALGCGVFWKILAKLSEPSHDDS